MNPLARKSSESQKKYRERLRKMNERGNGRHGWVLWDSMKKGTYHNPDKVRAKHPNFHQGQNPKLAKQPETASGKNNKFKGFRKIRGTRTIGRHVITCWVPA